MAQAPFTPHTNEYTVAKTPEGGHLQNHEAKTGVSPWSARLRLVGNAAQWLIFGAMFLYVYGQLAYFTEVYSLKLTPTFKEWWGVPLVATPGVVKGHNEMVRPTYFLLFAALPLFASVLLIEFLRHYNLRRITGNFMLKIAMVLRRKPALFGRVSPWSFGEWLFMLGIILGNIYVFYKFYKPRMDRAKTNAKGNPIPFNTYLTNVALTLGFSCIFNMAFLFLPATRNCVWMEVLNISYANGIKYHRWLGVVTVVTAFLHCVGYYWVWIRQGTWKDQALPCFDCNIGERKGFKIWFNVFGELALLTFIFIGLTSIPYVRRQFYNVFYYTHQLLFLGVIFSVMHWAPIIWWVLPTFLLYCFHRAVSASNSFTPVEVAELTAIADDLVKVVIKRSPGRDGHYRVGQFLYLNVPAISKLQWHAFTISSSPRTSPTTVTVLLKSLGDWTQELVTYANDCKQKSVLPTVYVDGYYGASLEMYDEYSTVCLVGGGIGATPMFAILEDLAAKLANHETIKQKVVFVFSFREIALLEEVHPVLMRLKELDPQEKYFKTHFYLTRMPDHLTLRQKIRKSWSEPSHVYLKSEKTRPGAFYEPLRSRTVKIFSALGIFSLAVCFCAFVEYDNPIRRRRIELWPLQNFFVGLVPVVGIVLIALAAAFEAVVRRRQPMTARPIDRSSIEASWRSTPAPLFEVQTYRDLLSYYGLVLGERPNTKKLMAEAFEFHNDTNVDTYGKPVIGVFVSGPEAMKRAVEYAAAEIGTSHFDIHEEEFEL